MDNESAKPYVRRSAKNEITGRKSMYSGGKMPTMTSVEKKRPTCNAKKEPGPVS